MPAESPSAVPYDALLVLSFGGPEARADVMPFLENVTRGPRGRGISHERLAEVAEHYDAFGGRSPINDQNRALVAAVEADLAGHGINVPVYWGNRNWHPYLTDELVRMRDEGVQRAAVFLTSAYSSYSGCRQYREDLAASMAQVDRAPRLDRLRQYYDHPGFVEANTDAVAAALDGLSPDVARAARIVYVTHSIPVAMANSSGPSGGAYEAQHHAVAAAVTRGVWRRTGLQPGYDLVYCSRSGPPSVPWLEPDVNDHLEQLAAAGTEGVVLAPIGFVSDHMEVAFDLDTEALTTAARLGLPATRAATAGTHPAFVAMVRDLLLERAAVERGEEVGRESIGPPGPAADLCPAGCCPNLRESLPAACGAQPAVPIGRLR